MVFLYDMLCPTVLIKETNISQLDHLDHLGDYVHSELQNLNSKDAYFATKNSTKNGPKMT